MKYKTLIVDGSYLAHQASNALSNFKTSTGLPSGLIYGFVNTLNSICKRYPTSFLFVCWEGKKHWRRSLLPGYKSSRPSLDNNYLTQLHDLQTLLSHLGIKQVSPEYGEADDAISILTLSSPTPILIYTGDKDLLQLCTDSIHILSRRYYKSGSKYKLYTPEEVKNEYLVSPSELHILLSITGDQADDIPGLPGYGPKVASKILNDGVPFEEAFSPSELNTITRNIELIKLPPPEKYRTLIDIKNNSPLTENEIYEKYGLRRFKMQPNYLSPLRRS